MNSRASARISLPVAEVAWMLLNGCGYCIGKSSRNDNKRETMTDSWHDIIPCNGSPSSRV